MSATDGADSDRCPDVAVILVTCYLTLTATSRLAELLFPCLRPGDNLARQVFLGPVPGAPTPGALPPCTRDAGDQVVAALRSTIGRTDGDGELRRLVGELSALSREFSTAWAHASAALRPLGIHRFVHPVVGVLTLEYELIPVASSCSDIVIVWRGADAASVSALDRLRRLSNEV